MKTFLRVILSIVVPIAGFGYLALWFFDSARWEVDTLEKIQGRGTLIFLTRNSPTTYYEGVDGKTGFEFEMAQSFAKFLGVKLEVQSLQSLSEIFEALQKGKGDIAGASIVRTSSRAEKVDFGPDYHVVQPQVICRRGGKSPKNIQELVNYPLLVAQDNNHEEYLRRLQEDYPSLQWDTTENSSTEEILVKVWKKEVACTIADSHIVDLNRRYYPELSVAFSLGNGQPLAWGLKKNSHVLQEKVQSWFIHFRDSGKLAILRDRYYEYTQEFDYVNIAVFHRRIRERLPKYQSHFVSAASEYNLSWTALAAQAYEESGWNPRAKSATGVRGIMMLTQNTAKSLGIKNRLDPIQSITGGAKYLSQLIERVPEGVEGQDRLSFALAAYNIGMGHMHDAQTLTRRLGKNPNSWQDLKSVLPLLSQKKYHSTLKYGYARGREPVRYVERLYNYLDVLEQKIGDSILYKSTPAGL